MWGGVALRAGGGFGNAYPVLVRAKPRTVARSKLRQCRPVMSRERALGRVDRGWNRPQDTAWRGVPQVGPDCLRVQTTEGLFSILAGNNPIHQPGGQPVGVCRLERPDSRPMSGSRWKGDIGVRRVVGV